MGIKEKLFGDNESTSESTTLKVYESEKPKKKKAPKKAPQLAKDREQILNLKGKFFGGIAEMEIDSSTLTLETTQRIIIKHKSRMFEYTRTRII